MPPKKPNPDDERLLSKQQAARLLGISVRSLDRYTADPTVDLPPPRMIMGRRKFWRDSLIQWIEDQGD